VQLDADGSGGVTLEEYMTAAGFGEEFKRVQGAKEAEVAKQEAPQALPVNEDTNAAVGTVNKNKLKRGRRMSRRMSASMAKKLSADGTLQELQAAFKEPNAEAATTGAQTKDCETAETALDAAVAEAAVGSIALDAAVAEAAVGSTALDAAVAEAAVGSTALDAAVVEAAVGSTALDAAVVEAAVGSTALDAAVVEAAVGSTALDAAVVEAAVGSMVVEGVEEAGNKQVNGKGLIESTEEAPCIHHATKQYPPEFVRSATLLQARIRACTSRSRLVRAMGLSNGSCLALPGTVQVSYGPRTRKKGSTRRGT
jgi:hypothetical protein